MGVPRTIHAQYARLRLAVGFPGEKGLAGYVSFESPGPEALADQLPPHNPGLRHHLRHGGHEAVTRQAYRQKGRLEVGTDQSQWWATPRP